MLIALVKRILRLRQRRTVLKENKLLKGLRVSEGWIRNNVYEQGQRK